MKEDSGGYRGIVREIENENEKGARAEDAADMCWIFWGR